MNNIDRIAFDFGWEAVLSRLPKSLDLDTTARQTGAFIRARRITSAADLLRSVMAYCTCDMSFRLTAVWAQNIGLADISDVAMMNRIRKSKNWLSYLVSAVLKERGGQSLSSHKKIRLIDTTYIRDGNGSESKYSDVWRIHSSFDLNTMCFDDFKLTDETGAEDVRHFSYEIGTTVVADRGYAKAAQLFYLKEQGCDFIIRIGTRSLPLRNTDGTRLRITELASSINDYDAHHFKALVAPNKRVFGQSNSMLPIRLIIIKKSSEDGLHTRQKVIEKARRNRGNKPTAESLMMADYCVFATTLKEQDYSNADILALYRLRWQIEIAFKRLKSIVQIDKFQVKDPELIQCCFLASLLLALLIEDESIGPTQVMNAKIRLAKPVSRRCVSIWRIHSLILSQMKSAIIGMTLGVMNTTSNVAALWRNICEPPRRRRLQGITIIDT